MCGTWKKFPKPCWPIIPNPSCETLPLIFIFDISTVKGNVLKINISIFKYGTVGTCLNKRIWRLAVGCSPSLLLHASAYQGRFANLLGPQTVSPKAGARNHSTRQKQHISSSQTAKTVQSSSQTISKFGVQMISGASADVFLDNADKKGMVTGQRRGWVGVVVKMSMTSGRDRGR